MGSNISKSLIITVVSLAILTFLGIFSETSLAIVSPFLMTEFNVTEIYVQWLTSGFLLILAVAIPLSPFLVKTVSTKLLFQMAVIINVLGALLGGFAVNFTMLLLGRLIMAVGTGLSLPLLTNIVLEECAPQQRGALLGLAGFVASFAPVLGPVLGGVISEYFGWRWIFLFMVPVLIISFIMGSITIRDIRKDSKYYLDIKSFIISSAGLVSFIIGLSLTSYKGILLILFSIVMLFLFLYMQKKSSNPLINTKVLNYKMFKLGLITVCVPMSVILALAFLIPIYAQNGLGKKALESSFILFPGAALTGLIAPVMGIKYSKYGVRKLLIPGFTLMSLAMLYIIISEKTYINAIISYFTLMLGVSFCHIPAQANTLNALPNKYNPDGTAVLNTLHQLSGAAGTALSSALLSFGTSRQDYTSINDIYKYGSDYGFIFCFVICVIGLITALNLKTTIKIKR
mgnify:CR=1 FL=1